MSITARSPLAAIQRAIYQRLNGDAELGAAVYDQVPEDAPMPYVVLGEATETPDNWHGGIGRNSTHTLHVWSQQPTFDEANAVADCVVQLLDHQPMPLHAAEWVVTAVRFEFAQTLRDPHPPHARHIPVRFRINTEQPEDEEG